MSLCLELVRSSFIPGSLEYFPSFAFAILSLALIAKAQLPVKVLSIVLFLGSLSLILLRVDPSFCDIYVAGKFLDNTEYVLSVYSLGLVTAFILCSHSLSLHFSSYIRFSSKQARILLILLSLIVLIGAFICGSYVSFNFLGLLAGSREHEEMFGSNKLALYSFFLGTLPLCLAIYLVQLHIISRRFLTLLFVSLNIFGLLSGVKFTLFDLNIPALFFWLICANYFSGHSPFSLKRLRITPRTIILFTIALYAIVFVLSFLLNNARKGLSDIVLDLNPLSTLALVFSYVAPQYVLLGANLESTISCDLLSLVIPSKIATFCSGASLYAEWSLSEKYNMSTALSSLYTVSPLAVFLFPILVAFAINILKNSIIKLSFLPSPAASVQHGTYALAFIPAQSFSLVLFNLILACSFLLYSSSMMFFYFAFNREKFFGMAIILLAVSCFFAIFTRRSN